MMTYPTYGPALQQLQTQNPKSDQEFGDNLEDMLPYNFADPRKYVPVLAGHMTKPISLWAFGTHQAACRQTPIPQREMLFSVQAKTLIVVGTEDAFCTVIVARVAHAGMAGSELAIHEGGHFPWIETKEQFNCFTVRQELTVGMYDVCLGLSLLFQIPGLALFEPPLPSNI
jgi:pimeloyl-ACP methyl ester carboxylesterase